MLKALQFVVLIIICIPPSLFAQTWESLPDIPEKLTFPVTAVVDGKYILWVVVELAELQISIISMIHNPIHGRLKHLFLTKRNNQQERQIMVKFIFLEEDFRLLVPGKGSLCL